MTSLLHEAEILCPWCGEQFTTLIDKSVAHQTYIEDCQVCCSPIEFDIRIVEDTVQLNTRRDND